jgi:hypothetical protein
MSGLNVYNLYGRCLSAGEPLDPNTKSSHLLGEVMVGGEVKKYKKFYTAKEYTPWLYDHPSDNLKDENPLGPCSFGIPMIEFINDPEVRDLLHIPTTV